jgi:cytochrome c oxidase subunit 2
MSQPAMHIHPVERAWIIIGGVMLAVFAVAVFVSSFAYGFQLPVPEAVVDPAKVATPGATSFGEPGLKELAPGRYEARVLAQTWLFTPKEIRIPAGSKVTFYFTSKDVQHGVHVDATNINLMILPGQVSKLTATFDTPGTYKFICHEFCGVGHQTMFGQIVVEP